MTIAIIDSGYSGSRKERIAGGISVKVSAIYKDVLSKEKEIYTGIIELLSVHWLLRRYLWKRSL